MGLPRPENRQGSWSQGHRRVQCCQFDGHFFELLNELSKFAQCVELINVAVFGLVVSAAYARHTDVPTTSVSN